MATKRDQIMQVTFSESEHAEIKKVADHHGLTFSAFIRMVALQRARGDA